VSVTSERVVRCACGAEVLVLLAESLNAERHPQLRAAVLARTLHTERCGGCGERVVVLSRLVYVDLGRRQLIGVYLDEDRARERICGEELLAAYERCVVTGPAFLRAVADDFLVRVVFSYEELREKLVADEAELSDLALEATKLDLLGDERLRSLAAVTLRLDEVRADGLHLHAESLDGRPLPAHLVVPRASVDEKPARDALRTAYPGIAAGPHVSVLRLFTASEAW
jgi:hypothetical protein